MIQQDYFNAFKPDKIIEDNFFKERFNFGSRKKSLFSYFTIEYLTASHQKDSLTVL
jgi:hypothetical protein